MTVARSCTAVCVLLFACLHAASAADAEAWKSQIIYFLVTDRFSLAPGVQPSSACRLLEWNSGSWSGITNKLGYIKDLGMTAIWITPISYQFQGNFFGYTGYHGYWTEDFTRLEPHYGTEDDLQKLLKAAKEQGVMTMLDVVANHVAPVGHNYTAITPFNNSQHYHRCDGGCDDTCNIPQAAYDSRNLELIETCRLAGLPDLNQSEPFVHQQLLSLVNSTLTKFDFDGLRLDTVKHVNKHFWRNYSQAAGVFSMGEVMHGDNRVIAEYITGPQPPLPSVLNFPLYYKFVDVFGKQQDMRQILWERQQQQALLGPELISRLGVFIDNHDFPRFLAHQPDQQLLKNALAFALLTEGIPIIYYGTEAGFNGSAAQEANRECLWEAGFSTDGDLFTFIRTLAGLRTNRTLWQLPQEDLNVTSNCYIFSRGPDVLVFTTNVGNSSSSSSVRLPNVSKLVGVSADADTADNSSVMTCIVTLPENFTMLDKGVESVTDVLNPEQASAHGVTWQPASRTFTVAVPAGSPRVLTGTRYSAPRLSSSNSSGGGNGSGDILNNTGTYTAHAWTPKGQAQQQQQQGSSNAAGSCRHQQQGALGRLGRWVAAVAAIAVVSAAAA